MNLSTWPAQELVSVVPGREREGTIMLFYSPIGTG